MHPMRERPLLLATRIERVNQWLADEFHRLRRVTDMAAKLPKRPLIRKLRKPTAPPTRVAEDERKYERARERERLRRGDLDQAEQPK